MLYDFLGIEKEIATPLYEQVYSGIKASIISGRLTHNEKLPSIRRLADQLGVSRTTVETAYDQLCAEGYVTNKQQKGFYVEADDNIVNEKIIKKPEKNLLAAAEQEMKIKFDFSSSSIDPSYVDFKFWKRCIKNVLDNHRVISSYGMAQGESVLREVLCEYSGNVRGVSANVENIVVGAGTQTLLTVLLGLCKEYGKSVAIEKGFFPQGEQIFEDFGFDFEYLKADKYSIILDESVKSRILFVNSSGSIRGSAPVPINKRMEIIKWAEENDAVVIEDDFNGELRYTSKPVPALQGLNPDRVVYIGSFSKLLLPSVRISYMVLPDSLARIYISRKNNYNQTSSKAEQLALAEYIRSGRLERQLRKLRKVYLIKSKLLLDELKRTFGGSAIVEVIETALCVRIKLKSEKSLEYLKAAAENGGIRLGKCREKNGLKYFYLCFAGLSEDEIPPAVKYLYEIWEQF